MADEARPELARDPQELERLLVSRLGRETSTGLLPSMSPMPSSTGGDGRLMHGRDAIRAFFARLAATGRTFELEDQRPVAVSGDLALTSARAADGSVIAEVARRQSDGTWLWVIDLFSNA